MPVSPCKRALPEADEIPGPRCLAICRAFLADEPRLHFLQETSYKFGIYSYEHYIESAFQFARVAPVHQTNKSFEGRRDKVRQPKQRFLRSNACTMLAGIRNNIRAMRIELTQLVSRWWCCAASWFCRFFVSLRMPTVFQSGQHRCFFTLLLITRQATATTEVYRQQDDHDDSNGYPSYHATAEVYGCGSMVRCRHYHDWLCGRKDCRGIDTRRDRCGRAKCRSCIICLETPVSRRLRDSRQPNARDAWTQVSRAFASYLCQRPVLT